MWITPNSRDWKDTVNQKRERQDGRSRDDQLPRQVAGIALWLTPSASEDAAGSVKGNMQSMLTHQAKLVYGITPDMSPATMASFGQLNPAFPCWLMGFSTAALSSMHWAMQSCRKSRRNSSKQARISNNG